MAPTSISWHAKLANCRGQSSHTAKTPSKKHAFNSTSTNAASSLNAESLKSNHQNAEYDSLNRVDIDSVASWWREISGSLGGLARSDRAKASKLEG